MCKNVKNVELETEIDARYLKSPKKENSLKSTSQSKHAELGEKS